MKKNNMLVPPPPRKSELRRRAEKEAALRKQSLEVPYLSDEEISWLIHDLQVHQIELEIQNEELKEKQNELEESRNKYFDLYETYSDLYDFAPVGYFTLGEKAAISEVNLTGAALLGVERNVLIGQPLTRFIDSRSQDDFYLHRAKVFDTKELQTCEIRMKKTDGALFHSQLKSIISHTAPDVWRTAVSDISERVSMESRLRQAQKMAAIGTLAGGIAHDFNNVLFPITGYAEMAIEEVPEGCPQIRENLKEILRGGRRAAALVRQILDFSRLDDNKLHMPVMVQPLLKEALKLLRSSLPSDIEICQNIDMNAGFVMGNTVQIHQVIMNLCINAYHAMEDKGGTLEVNLAEVYIDSDSTDEINPEPGNYLCLVVSDTGQGMEPEVKERIFEPYFTTKEQGKGTGMGLAMTHGIVGSHGGKIVVRSNPGRGSSFHVYLPLVSGSADVSEAPHPDPLPRGTERILFVDDEEPIVNVIKQSLERIGYSVTGLTSPADALELFRSNPEQFDIVITDTTMPRLMGDELARELMKIRPDIPIIICTGFNQRITEEKVKAMGIQALVMKPVRSSQMAGMIRKVLDNN
ncbi:response regulator [Desulfococcaceae bacterium HSG8]|nr:response regulator [Desulfococcaceae bacterium HSG8]